MDAATMDAVVPAPTAAIGTYGREVLVGTEERAGDEEFQSALRAGAKTALSRDPRLARDLAGLLREGGATVTATGDGATHRIER